MGLVAAAEISDEGWGKRDVSEGHAHWSALVWHVQSDHRDLESCCECLL